jgi:hypothetical protein
MCFVPLVRKRRARFQSAVAVGIVLTETELPQQFTVFFRTPAPYKGSA